MTEVGKFLIEETHKEMDTRQRMASGESVQTLKEEVYSGGIRILGVDYWKYINEGRTAGGMPPVDKIRAWMSDKQRRYGLTFSKGAEWAIAKNIAQKGAPANRSNLEITEKVLQRVKPELDKLVKKYFDGKLQLNNN